jgi:hypothetical protein
MKSGERSHAFAAAKRAARMPIRRADQKVHLAMWLHEGGEAADAHRIFQDALKIGLPSLAAQMRVPAPELVQMSRTLARAAGAG